MSSASKFADAVRVLLYGNGDVRDQIEALAKVLAEHDDCRPKGDNRLTLMANKLDQVKELYWFNSDEWNANDS